MDIKLETLGNKIKPAIDQKKFHLCEEPIYNHHDFRNKLASVIRITSWSGFGEKRTLKMVQKKWNDN